MIWVFMICPVMSGNGAGTGMIVDIILIHPLVIPQAPLQVRPESLVAVIGAALLTTVGQRIVTTTIRPSASFTLASASQEVSRSLSFWNLEFGSFLIFWSALTVLVPY